MSRKFGIISCDIVLDGEDYGDPDQIDIREIAMYSQLSKGTRNDELFFKWDEDLRYQKRPRLNKIVFSNVQERGMAFTYARKCRLEADIDMLSNGYVRAKVTEIGSDGDWNGTIWLGQVRKINLSQPDFRFDVINRELQYGRLSCREAISNPMMIVPVAKFLGPGKCFNLPPDGLEHDFTRYYDLTRSIM